MSIKDKLKVSKLEPVEVMGETIYLKVLTVRERVEIAKHKAEEATAAIVAACVVDASGQSIFSMDEVAELNGAEVERLAALAIRLNKMDRTSIDDLVKN